MRWEEMNWAEFSRVDINVPVIVPLGSCEQHAHHLPVFVDTFQVDHIARAIEARRSGFMLAPTLWLGCSHHHADFPGTLSVMPMVYAHLIQQVARSILRAGFRRILFLNGHGGNRAPANAGLSELSIGSEVADSANIALASWWELGATAMKSAGIGQQTIGHACEFETSLMLEIRNDLVNIEKIQPRANATENSWYSVEGGGHSRVAMFQRFHRLTASGGLGDSGNATREKGARLLDGLVGELVQFVDDFAKWLLLPIIGPK